MRCPSKQCLTSILPYRWRKRSINHACAETLLWIAQGKTKPKARSQPFSATAHLRFKKHVLAIFEKLNLETQNAASLRALEVLSSPAAHP
jgi:hypothetical protein